MYIEYAENAALHLWMHLFKTLEDIKSPEALRLPDAILKSPC